MKALLTQAPAVLAAPNSQARLAQAAPEKAVGLLAVPMADAGRLTPPGQGFAAGIPFVFLTVRGTQ